MNNNPSVITFFEKQELLSNIYLDAKITHLKPNEIKQIKKLMSNYDFQNFDVMKCIKSNNKIQVLEIFFTQRKSYIDEICNEIKKIKKNIFENVIDTV